MKILVGLENNFEGRSLGWALEYPGCFCYGADQAFALAALPRAVLDYQEWMARHTDHPWFDPGDFDIRLVEVFNDYTIDQNYEPVSEGYEVNAWFRQDWKPLSQVEIERGLQMLAWSRRDLEQVILQAETAGQMDVERPRERWSIRGTLKHVANADAWYLDRLELAPWTRPELPDDYRERLRVSRARLVEVLPALAGVDQVQGKQGEFWSPRKLLRRSLWHELDHIQHIRKLLDA